MLRSERNSSFSGSNAMWLRRLYQYGSRQPILDQRGILFTREWAMPNAWTFTIRPVAALLERYVGAGENWLDPFAGKHSPAKWTNDIHPERRAKYQLDAEVFARNAEKLTGIEYFDGVLFDPPYSNRQISEHYKEAGRRASSLDTSSNFYARVKDELGPRIRRGGLAISFGWNSVGFGKKHDFEIIEILLVSHGGAKNDTIVTVERKQQARPGWSRG